jgi:LPS-assembly lipoprotein
MKTMTRLLFLVAMLFLASCGFHLRGQYGMPFNSLYLDAPNPNSPFIAELRRKLEAKQVKMTASAEQADVILNIVFEASDKQILSLGGAGRVNGFRLTYRVSLRAYDNNKQDWIPAEEMTLRRDYTYDDAKILAKEAEETLLYQVTRSEMAQQIMYRLSRSKPQSQ